MLIRYTLTLRQEGSEGRPQAEWAYRLYAALLAQAPSGFAERVHDNAITPLSQFLTINGEDLIWRVTLLGEESRAALEPVLAGQETYRLMRDRAILQVVRREWEEIADVDALFARSADLSGRHRLEFRTPTAFKSQKQYCILPTGRLVLQSLIGKWNGSFPACPIEDEDGAGLDAMAGGLVCSGMALHDCAYSVKGRRIPGFVGSLTWENRLTGFHRTLTDALLLFSGYAGLGIKTTLGMGGVLWQTIE